jgi:ornithine decarboxylase
LQFSQALVEASRDLQTPILVLDPHVVREQYGRIASSIRGVEVHYAVKANPHPEIARIIAELGGGFEVSSTAELELAVAAGARIDRVISSNPVKPVEFIRHAAARGMRHFVFDSEAELDKLARHAPHSELCLRIVVDNSDSEWPLSRKYGVEASAALPLLLMARERGLDVAGLTFHVGSQCFSTRAWVRALSTCREIFDEAAAAGLRLDFLNLGGGLPVRHLRPVPSIAEVGETIAAYVRDEFAWPVRLSIEPGRAIVGEAATLVTTVIGKAERADGRWLYVDAGVFNALMETIDGFRYELRTDVGGPCHKTTLAGPSCDTVDVLYDEVMLPDLEVGDRLYVMNAGAYTLSYASTFNGFLPPAVHFVPQGSLVSGGQAGELAHERKR